MIEKRLRKIIQQLILIFCILKKKKYEKIEELKELKSHQDAKLCYICVERI